MSEDIEKRERHLTPNGWVFGSVYANGTKVTDVPIPQDRVETCIEELNDSSGGWDPPTVSWEAVWQSPYMAADERDDLLKKFPPPKYVPWKKRPRRKRKPLE